MQYIPCHPTPLTPHQSTKAIHEAATFQSFPTYQGFGNMAFLCNETIVGAFEPTSNFFVDQKKITKTTLLSLDSLEQEVVKSFFVQLEMVLTQDFT